MIIHDYEGTICKPAQELGVFLVPAVNGCSHNKCTFCCFYKNQKYGMIPLPEIEEELIRAKDKGAVVKRAMLVGGDPLALPVKDLLAINDLVRRYFPELGVLTTEGSIQNLMRKSDEDLLALKEAGFDDFYIGIESGLDSVLTHIRKGHTVAQAQEQLARLDRLGIRYGVNLVFGIAGAGMGVENAKATAAFINKTHPFSMVILSLYLTKTCEMYQEVQDGRFRLASPEELVEEERVLLEEMTVTDLKYDGFIGEPAIRLTGKFPDDKDRMMKKLTVLRDHYLAAKE